MRSSLAPGRTLRRIAQVYVEQARFILPVAIVLFVPLGLLEAWGEHAFELEAEDLDAAKLAGLLVAAVVQVATSSLGEVFYAGVVMSAVSESMEGHERPPVRKLLRTLPYGGLIVVDLLFSLGLAFGLVLLLVPGLIFFARYVLAAPLLGARARRRAPGVQPQPSARARARAGSAPAAGRVVARHGPALGPLG